MDGNSDALEQVFGARSRNRWSDRPVPVALIQRLYDLVKLGPTSMNSSPARFRFLMSPDAKERLAAHVMPGNKPKVTSAPCIAIIAYDEKFYDHMPKLFPIREGVGEMFSSNPALAHDTAFRNGTLQGAYLIVAARLLGLDCGPMSGFDSAGVDDAFFSGSTLRTNFICSIGYADDEPMPRLPRLEFDEAAAIV